MKTMIILFFLFPFTSFAASTVCATPADCANIEEAQRAEAVRVQKEQAEARYKQQQLELQAAQLRELQEQRAVMEEELTELNDSQSRMEDLQQKEYDEAHAQKKPSEEK